MPSVIVFPQSPSEHLGSFWQLIFWTFMVRFWQDLEIAYIFLQEHMALSSCRIMASSCKDFGKFLHDLGKILNKVLCKILLLRSWQDLQPAIIYTYVKYICNKHVIPYPQEGRRSTSCLSWRGGQDSRTGVVKALVNWYSPNLAMTCI